MSEAPGCVIIVDDDAAVRDSLKFALELEGFAVRLYSRGQELLAEGELPQHACLVLDYVMPAMNGLELLARLRRRNVDAPAVLITARAGERLRRAAAHVGFAAMLEKPLEGDALVDCIRRFAAGKPGPDNAAPGYANLLRVSI